MAIKYRSTNRRSENVDFKTALLEGQAPDKGLYMPDSIPVFTENELEAITKMDIPEMALTIQYPFLKDSIPKTELGKIMKTAYNFSLPMEEVGGGKYILRLDRGPTLSFKDIGARTMAGLMQYFMSAEYKHITIPVATSGDTGSAVASAFYGMNNIDCVILFPEKEVTEMQRKQMTTLGQNITAIAINGKFDDCQAIVKQAFSDDDLRDMNLSSANSINFGRLMPQMLQHFYAYAQSIDKYNSAPIISVPSGNFGHLTAGLIAKKMGLPVEKFVAATNENYEFPRFMDTCEYSPLAPSIESLSNAMNVGHPSNLARIFDLYGGQMDEKGAIIKRPEMKAMANDIYARSISDRETRDAIKNVYDEHKIILEPHGAVAWAGLETLQNSSHDPGYAPCISFETASPAKFPEKIYEIIGVWPRSDVLEELANKKEHFTKLPNDYSEFRAFLKNKM